MLCNFTFHFTKNYLTWAKHQHEQFNLNYSTKHVFTQKLIFRVTVHMNSKTLGFTVRINSSNHRFTLGTRISWPFPASHTSQYNLRSLSKLLKSSTHTLPSPRNTTFLLVPTNSDGRIARKPREKALSLTLKTNLKCPLNLTRSFWLFKR